MERISRIIQNVYEPNKNMHSEIHYWADTISRAFGERNRFGMYLGVIKRIGVDRAKQLYSEIRQSAAKNPGKLFIWKSKTIGKEEKKPEEKK